MSIKLMSQVWDNATDVNGGTLLVLLSLADHANEKGFCWPSMQRLAQCARLSERQTQRTLKRLIEEGYVSRIKVGNGAGNVSIYRVYPTGNAHEDMAEAASNDVGNDKMSPLSEPEKKGDIYDKKGDIPSERVTPVSPKGDADVTQNHQEPPIPANVKEPSASNDAGASPAPTAPSPDKPEQKPKDDPKQNSAVQVFREVEHRWPNKTQMGEIATVIEDLELWREVVQEWNMRGYKPTNVAGMLQWYKQPSRFRDTVPKAENNGYTNQATSKSDRSMAAVDRVFAQLEQQS